MKSFSKYLILVFTFILIDEIDSKGTDLSSVPDMCLHSSRFNSLTQFVTFDQKKNQTILYFFFTSKTYYWIIDSNTFPAIDNSKGSLPFGFRGDAAFFRQWKRCEDNKKIVPMIIVVDSNGTDLKYLIYYIDTQKWSDRAFNASQDFALNKINLYKDFKSLDTIMNFANIRLGSRLLGDENLLIFSSHKNDSVFIDWVKLVGCMQTNGTFKGESKEFFKGTVDQELWPMKKPIDAAMVYLLYGNKDKKNDDIGMYDMADISLFQENAHYMFSVDLHYIATMGFLHLNKSAALVVQYYSSWMGCSDGVTPEPPVLPQGMERLWTHTTQRTTVFGQTNDKINEKEEPTEGLNETIGETVNTIPEKGLDWVHDHSLEDQGTVKAYVISCLMVLFVIVIIAILSFFMFVKKTEEKGSE